jgi:hypothetical protein
MTRLEDLQPTAAVGGMPRDQVFTGGRRMVVRRVPCRDQAREALITNFHQGLR